MSTATGTLGTTLGSGGASSANSTMGSTLGAGGTGAGVGGSAGSSAGGASTGGASTSGAGNGGSGGTGNTRPANVLLYWFSTLDIPSVPAQLDILEAHLTGLGYSSERSIDPAVFTDENLANYAAVGMINTCFSPFGANNATGQAEAEVLQRFLEEGGGLFGTHCADVTFQSANPPALYNELLGGRASSQNFEGVSECHRTSNHPTAAGLPETFNYDGNLDNTDYLADDIEVLVRCDWGNQAASDVVVSWVRTQGAGRVFFSNFAKVDADLSNATIGEPHLLAGLSWVLGL
jgi:type 1 glutamine amidotransferase